MSESVPVSFGRRPDDCSLDDAALDTRLDDWRTALEFVTTRRPVQDGIRMELSDSAPLGRFAELMAAEQGCCSFFRFSLTVDSTGTALEVRADEEHRDVVDVLFGD